MIIGAHIVIASVDAEADHKFFREVLKLSSINADGGYTIIDLPASEASIHPTTGDVPQHELYLLCDNIEGFVNEMSANNVECDPVHDAGWGLIVKIKLPSGAPLQVYQPRHPRPSD
jgi:hypothetical protein